MSPGFVLHKNDIPDSLSFGARLALGTKSLGANFLRDRLCLLHIYDGQPDSQIHVIQFDKECYQAPNLCKILSNAQKQKIFFFARHDMQWIGRYLGIKIENIYCLKIASRIARTYTQSHEFDETCRQLLGIKIPKDVPNINWGLPQLSAEQLQTACSDLQYFHNLQEKLDLHLDQDQRRHIAYDLFLCLPALVKADLGGWQHDDIFSAFPAKI